MGAFSFLFFSANDIPGWSVSIYLFLDFNDLNLLLYLGCYWLFNYFFRCRIYSLVPAFVTWEVTVLAAVLVFYYAEYADISVYWKQATCSRFVVQTCPSYTLVTICRPCLGAWLRLASLNSLNLVKNLFYSILFQLADLKDSLAKFWSNWLKHVRVEMQILVLTKIAAAEARLQSVTILYAHFFPADHASRRFLWLLDRKWTVQKVENVRRFLKQEGKDLFFSLSLIFTRVSIHEHIFLAWMSVQVAV